MSSQRPSWEPGAGEKCRMLFKENLGTAGLIAPSVEFTQLLGDKMCPGSRVTEDRDPARSAELKWARQAAQGFV